MDRGTTRDARTFEASRRTLEDMAFAAGGRAAVMALPTVRFAAGPGARSHAIGRAVPKEGPVARARRAFRLAMGRLDKG